MEKEDWIREYDRAKALEAALPSEKRRAYELLKAQFPTIKQRNFGMLIHAFKAGEFDPTVAHVIEAVVSPVLDRIDEAAECRARSESLLAARQAAETRPLLDPSVDPIPAGEYPKLRQCSTYPLRKSCNYGENASARWNRCEYMQYDRSKSYSDPARWKCTAPK